MIYNFKRDTGLYILIVLGNSVPAAAGIQGGQALFILTGRKGFVDGFLEKAKLLITAE